MPMDNSTKVFIASMFFFIPLKNLCGKYKLAFKNSRNEIEPPDYMQDAGFACNYLDLTKKQFGKEQSFYYNSRNEVFGCELRRMIKCSPYILHYNPDRNSSRGMFFLLLSITIDKMFPVEEGSLPQFSLCTEDDLVSLRKAFYEPDKLGPYYPANDPVRFHRSWMQELVCEIEGGRSGIQRSRNVKFENCISEVCVADIKELNLSTLEEQFASAFKSQENNPICRPTVEDQIFCYGLLVGNDNYRRLKADDTNIPLPGGYSNNFTEVTYALFNNIVFLKKHHPFTIHDEKDEHVVVKPTELKHIQYIHEMCGLLYIETRLNKVKQLIKSERSFKIKEAISILAENMGTRLYKVQEIDKRAEYIYNAFGIREEFDRIKEQGNMLADAVNIKYSVRTNIWMIVLTAITVIVGILSLFDVKAVFDTITNINSTMNEAIQLTYTNVFLLLILACLVFICASIVIQMVTSKKKRGDEDYL